MLFYKQPYDCLLGLGLETKRCSDKLKLFVNSKYDFDDDTDLDIVGRLLKGMKSPCIVWDPWSQWPALAVGFEWRRRA